MFTAIVTSRQHASNSLQMTTAVPEMVMSVCPPASPDIWMERYQQADPDAATALVAALSPALLRFFRTQQATREQADGITWLRWPRA